jgi:hypothetical protein
MVRQRWSAILTGKNDTVILIETAVVREYARWCGGTAVRAASYPIRKNSKRRQPTAERLWYCRSISALTLYRGAVTVLQNQLKNSNKY